MNGNAWSKDERDEKRKLGACLTSGNPCPLESNRETIGKLYQGKWD
jgi:hypothetical protein